MIRVAVTVTTAYQNLPQPIRVINNDSKYAPVEKDASELLHREDGQWRLPEIRICHQHQLGMLE